MIELGLRMGALGPASKTVASGIADIGFSIDLTVPKLSEFNQAVVDLQKKTTWGQWGDVQNLGEKVSAGFDKGIKDIEDDTKKSKKALDDLAQSFTQLAQIGGDSLGGIVKALGTLVVSAKTAKESLDSISMGKKAGGLTGFLEISTGIAGIASAAIAAGKAIAGLFDRNKGRNLVEDFAKSMGGFDALQKKMLELGPEYDRLWKQLTQGKQSDTKGAQAAIDAVTEALERQKTKAGEAAQAAADDAAKTAKSQQEALDAITAKYADTISALDQEYKSLNDSVSQEAEEAVMGVVETQQRERMKQIEAEKAAQEAMRDAEIDAKKMTFEQWVKDGKATRDDLDEIFGKPLEIPYYFKAKNAPDGGGATYAPSASSSASGGRATTLTVPVYLDGKEVGRGMLRVLPSLLTGAGR
jgi:uncharacterized membrane-anchored protein YhcB (DUF1043 family)